MRWLSARIGGYARAATTAVRPVSPAALPALGDSLRSHRARITTQALDDALRSTQRQTPCCTVTALISLVQRCTSPVLRALGVKS